MELHVKTGRDLLKRGQWKEARAEFERALRVQESGEALEGLGTACSWLNDGDAAIEARERAFQIYKEAGDIRSAARVAIWLAMDYPEFRGEEAVASGWLQRARRLVEGLEPCEEQGLVLAVSANVKLLAEKDSTGARELAAQARAIAEEVTSNDVIMISRAIEGFALVIEGEIRNGMRLLDEATVTAVGGECEDLNLIGAACCLLISACEKVRDGDRAAQWCGHVKEFCRRWHIGSLFAVCRTQYSSVLLSRGDWSEAEEELTTATEELSERRPGLVGAATVRLAELRRRQGRFEEATKLYESVAAHPLSLLGQSAMALDGGQARTAVDCIQRFLRRVSSVDQIERLPGLELLIRAYVGTGEIEKARQTLAELRSIVDTATTEPFLAGVRYAEGMVAAADEQFDVALTCFEDAVDLFQKSQMPYESISARISLAEVLNRMERHERAQTEAQTARAEAERIGAAFLMRSADRVLGIHENRINPAHLSDQREEPLTPRETEILVLIAEGKENSQIAEELFLSVRTVERHISNAYQKLGITGKAARAAAATYALKNLSNSS